jgi:micrococcal nuclease
MDYIYKAHVVGVYDGDTITVDIDLGLDVWRKDIKLRLARIDAPEMRGTERIDGIKVRDYVRSLILNKDVTIQTFKDKTGKYGRYIVEVFVDGMNGINLNDHLIEKGMVEEY